MQTDNSPSSELEQALEPGEEVLWRGQPLFVVQLSGLDFIFIPFSIFWACFAILWMQFVFYKAWPWPDALLGVFFSVVAIYLLVGRFYLGAYLRSRRVYAVTTHRILISSVINGVKAMRLRNIIKMRLKEHRNDGTIVFDTNVAYHSRHSHGYRRTHYIRLKFERVPDAQLAYDVVLKRHSEMQRDEFGATWS